MALKTDIIFFKNEDDALSEIIRRNQIRRNFISWENRAFKLLRISLKSDCQFQEELMGDNQKLHDEPS